MLPALNYPTLRIFLDGMLFMMLVYTLISYVWHRKQIYSLYGLYLFCMFWYMFLNDQYHSSIDNHAPVNQIRFSMMLESIVQCISLIIYGRFAILLMDLQANDTVSVRLIYFTSILSAGLIVADLLCFLTDTTGNSYQAAFHSFSRYVLAVCAMATVPRILRLRNKALTFFITGTSFYIVGGMMGLVMYQIGWASRQPAYPFTFPMTPLEIGVILESIFVIIGISMLNRQTEQEKIQYQSQLIEQLQENERKQAKLNGLRDEIARDLHDEMGSQLSSISILSQTTSRYVTDERAQQRLSTIGQTARQVMESMREIVWSLNSSSDSLQNVGRRIQETAHTLFSDSPVRLHINLTETNTLHGLTEKQRRELHLIAKECLTNVLRHARAKHVGIRLKNKDNLLIMSIHDDGIGFESDNGSSGLGLSSVRQRAERLNAALRIESEFGEGTTVTLTCPLTVEKSRTGLLLGTIPA